MAKKPKPPQTKPVRKKPPERPDLDHYKKLLDEYVEPGCRQSELSKAGWLMAVELYNFLVDHCDQVDADGLFIVAQNMRIRELLAEIEELRQNTRRIVVQKQRPFLRKRRND
jgi:hypothetical protein